MKSLSNEFIDASNAALTFSLALSLRSSLFPAVSLMAHTILIYNFCIFIYIIHFAASNYNRHCHLHKRCWMFIESGKSTIQSGNSLRIVAIVFVFLCISKMNLKNLLQKFTNENHCVQKKRAHTQTVFQLKSEMHLNGAYEVCPIKSLNACFARIFRPKLLSMNCTKLQVKIPDMKC